MKSLRKQIEATGIEAKGALPQCKYMKLLANQDRGKEATAPI